MSGLSRFFSRQVCACGAVDCGGKWILSKVLRMAAAVVAAVVVVVVVVVAVAVAVESDECW